MRRSAKERSWRKLRKPHSGGLDVRAFQQAGIPGHAYIGGVGHKRPYKRCRGYHMRRPTAGQIAGTRNTALASIRNKEAICVLCSRYCSVKLNLTTKDPASEVI